MRHAGFCMLLAGCDLFFPLNDPPDPPDAPSASCDLTACPGSYLPITGRPNGRYHVPASNEGFLGAATRCIGENSDLVVPFTHLVVLDDQEELDRINDNFGNGAIVWIGLRRQLAGSGPFSPLSEQPTGFPPATGKPWASMEPDTNDCVAINNLGELDARNCAETHALLCECDCFRPSS